MAITKFYIEALRRYGTGDGRASRSEFWYFNLVLFALVFCGAVVAVVLEGAGASIVGTLLLLGISVFHIIPSWTVAVRRLHDTGRSGWWVLLSFVPIIGAIILIVFFAQKGTEGRNDYGAPAYTLDQL